MELLLVIVIWCFVDIFMDICTFTGGYGELKSGIC